MTAVTDDLQSTTKQDSKPGRARCPECGNDPSLWRAPPAVSMFHWRKMVPLVVLLLALAAFAWWFTGSRQQLGTSSGRALPILVDPPVTLDELTAIAEGDVRADEPTLVARLESLRRRVDPVTWPGREFLLIGVTKTPEIRMSGVMIGWPTQWFNVVEDRCYENAATKSGWKPVTTNPRGEPRNASSFRSTPEHLSPRERWHWGGSSLWHSPPPEETGGVVVTRTFRVLSVVPVIGLLIIAWFAAALAIWVANRFRARNRRLRGTVIKFGATLIMLTIIVIMAARGVKRYERTVFEPDSYLSPVTRTFAYRGFVQTEITEQDVLAAASNPKQDRELAQRILEAVTEKLPEGGFSGFERRWRNLDDRADDISDSPPRHMYLAGAFEKASESANGMMTFFDRLSWGLLITEEQYRTRPEFGPPAMLAVPEGLYWEYFSPTLLVTASRGDPDDLMRSIAINLEFAGAIVLGSWVLWLAVRTVCFAIHRRIAKRRVKRGRCGSCGQVVLAGAG